MKKVKKMIYFGLAIFVGLAIPLVNLFVPAAAAVGSALFFTETKHRTESNSEEIELLGR